MSLGTIYALLGRYAELINTVTCKDAERDSLIASGEEVNAVPDTLSHLSVRTFLGDGLEYSVRVNDLRVQIGRR